MRSIKYFALAIVLLSLSIQTLTINPASASGDSDNARNKAEKILTQKKYKNTDGKAPLDENVDRLSNWLGETKTKRNNKRVPQKERKVKQTNRAEPKGFSLPDLSALAYVMIIFVSVLAVGAIGFGIYKIISNHKKQTKDDETKDDEMEDIAWDDEESVLTKIDDINTLDHLADKAFNEGRFDIALRYKFRAGLLRLDKKNAIVFHPSTTNNSYQLVLSNDIFNKIVRSFNDITYGYNSCDATTYNLSLSLWSSLLTIERNSNDKNESVPNS